MVASRIGNVAGVVWQAASEPFAEAAVRRLEAGMRQIFVEVRRVEATRGPIRVDAARRPVGDPDRSSAKWASAFSEIAEDRVLVVSANASPCGAEVLLALTAWPERDAILLGDEGDEGDGGDGEPSAGIVRREAVLDWLRRPASAADAFEIERVGRADLGFDRISSDRPSDVSPKGPPAGGH